MSTEPDHMKNFVYVPDKTKPWFLEKPELQWPARYLLEKYSHIPPEDVERVVVDFRDRAWETYPFPCIGAFDFLDFWLATRNLLYPRLLARLKEGATFLDIGCCLGHDIRKLVFDGVPGENLAGVELRQGYIDLGYEFFRDKDTLGAKMYQGDVLEPITSEPWPQVEGKFDVVNLGMIIHVFEWDEQVALFERAIKALKPGQLGTTITGLGVGGIAGTVNPLLGKMIPIHNVETFGKLIDAVSEKTGTKWEVDAELDTCCSEYVPKFRWLGPGIRRMTFEITRVA